MNMNVLYENIHIVNDNGHVVNTTSKKSKHQNLFNYSLEHAKFVLSVFDTPELSSGFSIETGSQKLKNHSYQRTLDGKYLIQLSYSSKEITRTFELLKEQLKTIVDEHKDVVAIDLFYGLENPVCLNNDSIVIADTHFQKLHATFNVEKNHVSFTEAYNGSKVNYQYLNINNGFATSEKGTIVRIVTERKKETS